MRYLIEDYAAKAREIASEGIVLLQNENQTLPLKQGASVAVFGRNQFNYYKSGTGSGGMVNTSYVVSILQALEAEEGVSVNQYLKGEYEEWLTTHPFDAGQGWAGEPWVQEEMPLTDDIVRQARATSDIAITLIGRSAGEDCDNKGEEGSYFLAEIEKHMLQKVCAAFSKTIILLNVGNVIDMSWVDTCCPSAVAYVWQGGQEGGNAVLDVLMGRVNPSGKLPDTIVRDINSIPSSATFGGSKRAVYTEDIYVGYRYFETFAPEAVMYPFGFGLSYTAFSIEREIFTADIMSKKIIVNVSVENIGAVAGKQVVQLYVSAPQGRLGKPARSLCGFGKTGSIKPGQKEVLELIVPICLLASYDDSGVTGHKSAYVLEKGDYHFFVGTDVRSAVKTDTVTVDELIIVEQLSETMAPIETFDVIKPALEANGDYTIQKVPASIRTIDYMNRMAEHYPISYEITGNKGYKLHDVIDGSVSMEAFIAQLSIEDLISLSRGEGMCSPKVTPGIAGAIGGVTETLKELGIPLAGCADGPSGIRMDCGTLAFAMPCATLLAATFNQKLCRELYQWEGLELRKNKIDTLLGPGMNIHRNPLNGRNFEYFSEDPLLTGRMAAAQLKGMHKYDVTGTIKHMVCNNQETERHNVESIVSERALREIYLKGFEIAVKEGGAYSVMSSYNPVNGYWTASNYELLTVILREEWGYQGIVMTDWWAKGNFHGEEGTVYNTAAKALAQNDLFMVTADASDHTCDNSLEMLNNGKVPVGVYQRNAMNICRYLLNTPAYDRMLHGESELDKILKDFVFAGEELIACTMSWKVEEKPLITGTELCCMKGDVNLISAMVKTRGVYKIEIICRTVEGKSELAQIPLTILKDKELIGTISLTGTDKAWKTFTFENLLIVSNTFYIKLIFGQSGMQLKNVKLSLTMNLEDRLGH